MYWHNIVNRPPDRLVGHWGSGINFLTQAIIVPSVAQFSMDSAIHPPQWAFFEFCDSFGDEAAGAV